MIYSSKQWIKDLDMVLDMMEGMDELRGKTVLITGAAGLICSAAADILIRYNETRDGNIKILAAGRSEEKIRERFGEYFGRDYFEYAAYDATDSQFDLPVRADYIIHGASNASPGKIIREPVETMESNFSGLKALLGYARKAGTKRLLYISSSEVYGLKTSEEPFREDAYGYIDLLNPRNAYSVGKRAAETLCVSFASEYGLESVIVRPGHIYGPTASRSDNRVSSAWAYDAAEGKNIVMKSDGAQVRSYCHCLDCASAIITVLLKGKPSEAYNIANPDSKASIREMAEILTETAGAELSFELPTEEERRAFNPMNNSTLDSTKLSELGWKGLFNAPAGFAETIKVIKESMEETC